MLILGAGNEIGLKKQIRQKIPLLGDIPILGELFKYNIPSLRAVGDWTERYKALHEDRPEEKEIGQTVEWHRLDEMGFEWEASRGALAHYKAFGYMPTKRALKWWYRLSLLGGWEEGDVDIYKDAEYHGSLLYWARSYEEQEIQEIENILAGNF